MSIEGKQTFTFADDNGETSSITLNTVVLDALNFDAQATLRDNYRVALDAVCRGIPIRETTSTISTPNPLGSKSAFGHVETKMSIQYYDSVTNKRYVSEIPIADPATRVAGEDYIDLTDPLWAQYKTAFEAYALSPAGNPVVMTGGHWKGANL